MANQKCPFLIYEDFLSPKRCEFIVDSLGFYAPDTDTEGNPIKMSRHHEGSERVIFDRLESYIPNITKYYEIGYRGTEQMSFEYLAEGTVSEPVCENSNYINKQWARTKDRDLTGILFLSDYNDNPPFDSDYEVYGGKLEFPQHGFGFNPQRGTLIVYPSGPHFINANAAILAGDLFQVRMHIAADIPYMYDPKKFPGNYKTWFRGMF